MRSTLLLLVSVFILAPLSGQHHLFLEEQEITLPDGKVKGWVFPATASQEETLDDFKDYLNPNSLEILENCRLEPSLADAEPGSRFQFERLGYFCVDTADSKEGAPVFNRTVTLRDTWAKIQKAQNKPANI